MSFLSSLRMANIFPKDRAKDRPFGMPDIDDGDVGSMLRQVEPYAENANNNDLRRQKDLMQFQFNLNKPPMGRDPQDRLIASMQQNGQSGGQRQAAPNPNGGFSPMQKMFQERDARDKQNAYDRANQQSDLTAKFNQAMQLQKMKESGDMAMENVRGDRESANIAQRGGLDRDAAALQFQNNRQLAGDRVNAETAAAIQRQKGDVELQQMRETGLNTRDNTVVKATDPKDATTAFGNKIQQLAIDAPNLASQIEQNEKGGFSIKSSASPEQIAAIQQYIKNANQAPGQVPQKPGLNSAAPPIRKQTKGNQTRTSIDGGKTWVLDTSRVK